MLILYDIQQYTASVHSIYRSEITSSIYADFSLVDKQQLVFHWDGKIMADTTKKEDPKSKVDRLAVVVTGREKY